MTIQTIHFAPCDGFGTEGRSATLMVSEFDSIGLGYGETDDEAVTEALIDSGLTFDQAFEARAALMASAKQVRA